MTPVYFANCILILHALFVAIVVLSVPLIIAGGIGGWQWVRNPWFRYMHLSMIAFVACESLGGMTCPLTAMESRLRMHAAGQGYNSEGFIATWLDHLLFYNFPSWVFTMLYVSFALLVASLFYFVPVRKNRE